jgi:hypothetical protein
MVYNLIITMAPQEPQPRVEGVSLSGAMARQGEGLHHGQRHSTPHRRTLHDTEARGPQPDSLWARCTTVRQEAFLKYPGENTDGKRKTSSSHSCPCR